MWKVARYLPSSLGELDVLGLTRQEIRCHRRYILRIVEKAQQMNGNKYPQTVATLNKHSQYKNLFKEVKTVVK